MGKELQNEEKTTKSVDEMLLEFEGKNFRDNSSLLMFKGIEPEKDVYNITAPFENQGKTYIAGRVEARDSEHSEVVFFQQEEEVWIAKKELGTLQLQDPFVTHIGEELVLGGVEIFDHKEKPGTLNYRTVFYRGSSIETLKRFTHGPDGMKDIRLCQLENNKILVMTRPQGKVGGRGKIAYIIISSLDELNIEKIEQAKILENQFLPEEWGGCNELHLLKNGKVGVLAHIAKYDEAENRHYYSTVFCFDPKTGAYSPMKIIAIRDNFREGPCKREDIRDVIFSGGLVRKNETAQLYCGVSDAQGHRVTISDPFASFENK